MSDHATTGPLLDFVVVTYNSREWIERLLTSMHRNAGPAPFGVIVVDNGSADGTADYVREAHPEVVLIPNDTNRWLSPAINQGLQRCTAEFVAVVNPDCELITPDWVGVATRFLRGRADIGLAAPRLVDEQGRVQYSCRVDRTRRWALTQALFIPAMRSKVGLWADPRWAPAWQRDTLRDVEVVSGACMILPRVVLDRVGDFDERFRLYYEEDDMCRRVRAAGYRVVLLPDIELVHAEHRSVAQLSPVSVREILDESFFAFFEKYYGASFARMLTLARWVGMRVGALFR